MAQNSTENMTASNIDKADDSKGRGNTLKFDKHGLPLVPQPSDHKDDPLVSIWNDYKALTIAELALLDQSIYCCSGVNSGFHK